MAKPCLEGARGAGEKSRYSPLAVGNKGTCVPTGGPYCLNPHTGATQWRVPTFTFCSKVIMLRRAAVEILQYAATTAGRNLQPARRYYLTPRYTIYQREASCVPAARLEPRFDRGNNDRMERTMGRTGDAGGNAVASRQAAASRLGCDL